MKKVLSIIVSTAMVLSIFCFTVFTENISDNKTQDERIVLEKERVKENYELNKKLLETLEIESDVFSKTTNDELLLSNPIENNVFVKASDNLEMSHNIIDKDLPTEVNINLFDPLVLLFNTKSGITITKIDWYLEGESFSSPHEMEGVLTNSNLLVIPSVAFTHRDCFYIEALFDYYDENNKEEGRGYTGTVKVNVNTSLTKGINQAINIGDFTVFKGKSLNLSLLGIGEGIVSLNEDGSVITLNNVDFTYDPSKLYVDRFLTLNTGLSYYSYNNEFKNINVNLIGKNKISNLLRKKDIDEDGSTFMISCSGIGQDFEFNPNIRINGPGSLDVYGGQYCIQGFGTVIVDTKLNLTSSKYVREGYDTPARVGHGIYCVGAILEKNADVNMDIAGNGISASLLRDTSYGNIKLEKGSKLNIVNTNYIRHPWRSMNLPSKTNGLLFTNRLSINGSTVNMKFIADENAYEQYTRIYGDTNLTPYSAMGIYSTSKEIETSLTEINDSIIDISFEITNTNNINDFELIRAYGIDVSDTISLTDREHSKLYINNSKLNINIDEPNYINTLVGIRASDAIISNSDIDIKAHGKRSSYGIFLNEKANKNFETPYILDVTNSDVLIDVSRSDEKGESYGVLSGDTSFKYTDESKTFVVKADDGTIICYLGSGEELRYNEKNYIPTKISLNSEDEIVNGYKMNVISLSNALNSANKMSPKSEGYKSVEFGTKDYLRMLSSDIYNIDLILEDMLDESNAIGTYKYYETIFNDDAIAKYIVIKKKAEKPVKPSEKYTVPNTGA